jgi:hypothetical protein
MKADRMITVTLVMVYLPVDQKRYSADGIDVLRAG